jgi:hypothetical protein
MGRFIRRYLVPVALTLLLILVLVVCTLVNVPVQPAPEGTALVVKPAQVGTPTVTDTPTIIPTPTDTSTPTDTATPTLTPTPSITPTPTPRPPSIEILADEVAVRQGPSQSFPVLYVVHKGQFLIVQSKNIDFDRAPWFLIRVQPNGSEEWITGDTKYVGWYNVENLSCRLGPATPTPVGPPIVDPNFRADRTSLTVGECTYLRWDVEGVREVYLDGEGTAGHWAKQVCPRQTRTYVLKVHQRDGRWVDHPLKITVR